MARVKKAEGEAAGMTVSISPAVLAQADKFADGQAMFSRRQVREMLRTEAQKAVDAALGRQTVAALVRANVNAQMTEDTGGD